MSNNLILDPADGPQLRTVEERRNYLRERIEAVRQAHRNQPPPPTNEITGVQYLVWDRHRMILHGRAIEAILEAYRRQEITAEEFKMLQNQFIAATIVRAAEVQLGVG